MNHKKRPINLDLFSLKFPPMAIVSILHRISGVVIFLLFPIMLSMLSFSLESEDSFYKTKALLDGLYYKGVFWIFGSAILYHLWAGIRHILMDVGFGESITAGRRSAWMVLLVSGISIIVLGIWIW